MTDRTVVGWDASSAGRFALEWVAQREAASGELLLVRVVEDEQGLKTAQRLLDTSAAAIVRDRPGVRVRTEVVQGDVVDRLRRFSDPSNLLVVGGERPDHPGHGWTIGGRLAGSLDGPLTVIPEDEGSVRSRSTVVVGVDGSPPSFDAAVFAGREAEKRGEPLHIVHVWREPEVWQNAFSFDAALVEALEREHDEILSEVADLVERDFPRLRVHKELVRAHPARGLIAAGRNALLLVVGSRTHRGIGHMFPGSVSHSVLLNARGPTAIVSSAKTTGATGPTAATGVTETLGAIGTPLAEAVDLD
jgi:nucleotide-binding universal stress UspA family protein